MKLLKTIKDIDIFPEVNMTNEERYRLRLASRAVLFDENSNIALLHVTKYNYYKLPGGGVEEGESLEQALKRELLEETGCEAKIIHEVGEIIEYRDKFKIKSESYCWTAKVVGIKGKLSLTEREIKGGFELIWVSLDEAISFCENATPLNYEGLFIKRRDLILLKKAKELIIRELK